MDLQGDSRLRIVVPLGTVETSRIESSQEDRQITLKAEGTVGYEQCRYAVRSRGKGRVQLAFEAAEITQDGQTRALTAEPDLPFPLPRSGEYIRLVYLVRKSQADHNTVIIAAKRRDLLDVFTQKLERDPNVCATERQIFCISVPARIAVRSED